MTDPRYPKALQSDQPEFENDKQEIQYWKCLANAYAAKLGALGIVMKKTWKADVDPATGEVVVYEEESTS